MGGFFIRVFIGAPLSIPIAILFVGGPEAIGMMFMTIVCTAGVGLVFWIPIWWVLGAIVVDVIFGSLIGVGSHETPNKTQPSATGDGRVVPSDSKVLINYIVKAKRSGLSEEQIERRLIDRGWNPGDVTIALRRVSEA